MMPSYRVLAAFAAFVLLAAGGRAADAQSPPPPPDPGAGIFDEVRLGLLAHDVRFAGGRENGADINAELLFVSPFPAGWGNALPDWLAWLARPRPQIGGDANTSGYTDQAYAGLDWTVPILPRVFFVTDALTLDLDFGGEVNNGEIGPATDDRKALGSHELFRLGGEVGYHITPHLGAYVLFEHASNAHLDKYNQSLNDFGLRIGWRF